MMAKAHKTKAAAMAEDPVCGKEVKIADAIYTSDFGGNTYFFDSEECKKSFEGDPSIYIGSAADEDMD